ncbi:MAG: D-alanyl-D-alanine carboxypeptidase [Rhodospirillales bacterium]|nr:D-alanyl-D-alanine carboxypeptidase [Rhodospirillales bacterium]
MKRPPVTLTSVLLAAFAASAFAGTQKPAALQRPAAPAGAPRSAQSTVAPALYSGPPPQAPLAFPGVPAPPVLEQQAAYVLMDATTGAIIAQKAPDLAWPPASLTKLMTAYLTYQAIARGTIQLDQAVPISVAAWHTGGSRMFISPNMTVSVDELLHGLIIDSGNDAAVALAQAVAGNRGSFVGLMNHEAQVLGLTGTHYTNVDGLPDPDLHTTAMDVARLSRAILQTYPQYLKISIQKHYTYNNIRQRNWNPVLFHDATVDGLKTGLTKEAGHCIDATAIRNGRRLIAVVLGGPTWTASTHDIEALLDYGYQFYTNATVIAPGKAVGTLSAPTYRETSVPVAPARGVTMTIPSLALQKLKTDLVLDPPPPAGVRRGQTVGTLSVSVDGKALASVPVVAVADDPRAGFFELLLRRVKAAL